jgi:hypothetical protein
LLRRSLLQKLLSSAVTATIVDRSLENIWAGSGLEAGHPISMSESVAGGGKCVGFSGAG